MALGSLAALVNTAAQPDTLTSVTDLREFAADQGWSGRIDGDERELRRVRGLRPVLRQLWGRSTDEVVAQVNALLREAGALPQLVRHDGWDWHLHAVDNDAPLADRMVVEAAMAMVDVIRAGELERFRECAAPDCDGVLIDLSRNRSRRYCGVTCTNRVAARAHRARRSEEPART